MNFSDNILSFFDYFSYDMDKMNDAISDAEQLSGQILDGVEKIKNASVVASDMASKLAMDSEKQIFRFVSFFLGIFILLVVIFGSFIFWIRRRRQNPTKKPKGYIYEMPETTTTTNSFLDQ